MKTGSLTRYIQTLAMALPILLWLSCSHSMDQMYLLTASTSSYPTGTPIDSNSDGKVDGIDVNNDGLIDMKFVQPIGLPATGIDINNDTVADFYMYTTSAGSSFNTEEDGSGTTVSVIIQNGQLIGYDTNGNGVVDINVTGANVTYYKVGGSATGVTSSITLSLTINNSSYEYLTISANGTYQFTSNLNGGYFYQVAIASTTQLCTFPNNNTTGIIAATDITNIDITCGNLTVPVTIVWDGDTGATPLGSRTVGDMMLSLTINNSTTEYLSVPAATGTNAVQTATPVNFSSLLNTGAFYKVLIVSSTDNCIITSNTGSMPIGTPITITCAKFTVTNSTAAVVGLTAGNSVTVSLSVNGSFKETKTVTNPATAFTFITKLFANDAYNVQIVTATQSCKISANSGIVTTTNITAVQVTCAQFTVGGTINPNPTYTAALTSNMILSLSVNGVVVENILKASGTAANTAFTFATKVYTSDIYDVAIASTAQNCSISNNTGTIGGSVSNITVQCGQFTVQGDVVYTAGFGVAGAITLELQVISGNNVHTETTTLAIGAAPVTTPYGPFVWKLLSGDQYSIRVASETITGSCTPSAGAAGTIASANITTAHINCP